MARRHKATRSFVSRPPANRPRRVSARWVYIGIMVALAVVLILTMLPPPA